MPSVFIFIYDEASPENHPWLAGCSLAVILSAPEVTMISVLKLWNVELTHYSRNVHAADFREEPSLVPCQSQDKREGVFAFVSRGDA